MPIFPQYVGILLPFPPLWPTLPYTRTVNVAQQFRISVGFKSEPTFIVLDQEDSKVIILLLLLLLLLLPIIIIIVYLQSGIP